MILRNTIKVKYKYKIIIYDSLIFLINFLVTPFLTR